MSHEPRNAPSVVVALAVVSALVAVAAAIVLAAGDGDSWAAREPIASGVSIGVGLYALGLLTVIAVNSDR